MQSTNNMHNTFATNLLQSITEFSAFIFEADRAHKSGNDMNVQRALDYAEAKGVSSECTPQPPSNIMAEFEEVIIKN